MYNGRMHNGRMNNGRIHDGHRHDGRQWLTPRSPGWTEMRPELVNWWIDNDVFSRHLMYLIWADDSTPEGRNLHDQWVRIWIWKTELMNSLENVDYKSALGWQFDYRNLWTLTMLGPQPRWLSLQALLKLKLYLRFFSEFSEFSHF